MIGSQNVTFKTVDAEIEDVKTGEDRRTMDVVEITYPDGKVSAFPAESVSPETGRKYCDMYRGKYDAFKRGDPDPDRVDQLEREIAERQNELKALREKPEGDRRVQDNLGYGKQPDTASARVAAEHGQGEPDFDNMDDDEIRAWIEARGGDAPRKNASHATLVKAAEDLRDMEKTG